MEKYTIITQDSINDGHRQKIVDSIQQSYDNGDKVLPTTLESLQNSRNQWAILDTRKEIRYYCRALPLIDIEGRIVDELGTLIKIPQESSDLYGLASLLVGMAVNQYNQSGNILISTIRGGKSRHALEKGGMVEVNFDLVSRAITCSPGCHPGDGNIFCKLDETSLDCGACSSNDNKNLNSRGDICNLFISNPEKYKDLLEDLRCNYSKNEIFNPQLFRNLNNL